MYGGLAQLARAPALHAGGQRFESVILHNEDVRTEDRRSRSLKVLHRKKKTFIDILEQKKGIFPEYNVYVNTCYMAEEDGKVENLSLNE